MKIDFKRFFITLPILMLLSTGVISSAFAEEEEDERPAATSTNPKWQKECSECHVAFPARLLPAESWREIMTGLDKHFGSNASLDTATAKEISGYLEKHAGKKPASSDKPLLRITETRWFIREHNEVNERTWKNPKVKSPANCAACHTQAANGKYSERGIKIPK